MTYRILITGTRNELTNEQKWRIIQTIYQAHTHALTKCAEPIIVIHGACPTGVDALVDERAPRNVVTVESHPTDWKTHGRAAGPIRNAEMVSLGADVCLAFPMGASKGTRGCIKLAEDAGIPTIVTEL